MDKLKNKFINYYQNNKIKNLIFITIFILIILSTSIYYGIVITKIQLNGSTEVDTFVIIAALSLITSKLFTSIAPIYTLFLGIHFIIYDIKKKKEVLI